MRRDEDTLIAWAWRDYLARWALPDKPDELESSLAERIPFLPMAKAAMACMRAASDWAAGSEAVGAPIGEWVVSGASKRGWTSWLVGAAGPCTACPHIAAVAPLVPIVPSLSAEMHYQYKSYGGAFTFVYRDYVEAGILKWMDTPAMASFDAIAGPASSPAYARRLARLPRLAVISSDDEFMQFDWSSLWPRIGGEEHLLIDPNSEHSLVTGLPTLLSSMAALVASLVHGESRRPAFSVERDASASGGGTLTVTVDVARGPAPTRVALRHAQTLQTARRDFRWVRLAGTNDTAPCRLPGVPIKPVEGGGNCLEPIVWRSTSLEPQPQQHTRGPAAAQDAAANGRTTAAPAPRALVYKATPPAPRSGHWTGYFVELSFPSETLRHSPFLLTTRGFVWPETMPPHVACANISQCAIRLV